MFNRKEPNRYKCQQGDLIYHGNCSYIPIVTWDNFVKDDVSINSWLNYAAFNKDHKDEFDLHLNVDKDKK